MNAIETRNLTRRFGDITAVNQLNLTVGEGELFALLGVNGAGKTTAIRMLCGLLPPTSGDALLTNLSAWLSGIWFDVKLVGGAFAKIADVLPFIHAVEAARAAAAGDFAALPKHLAVVAVYALALLALAIFAFIRGMRGGKR